MQLTLMLQCHGDYEIEMLQPQSHRGRDFTPAKSEKPPASAQKVQIPEQRCQWKYRMPFSFTFQKHNVLVVKVYLRLPPVIWNSNSTEYPVVLGFLLLLLNLTLPQIAWDGNFAGFWSVPVPTCSSRVSILRLLQWWLWSCIQCDSCLQTASFS